MESVKQGISDPNKVLDGHDMNQDIGQLIGYVHSIGIQTGEKGTFPSEHFCALIETFLRKHRAVEERSPKRMANDAHMIKNLVADFRDTSKRYETVREKLAVHEYYMNQQRKLDSRMDSCIGSSRDYTADCVDKIAHGMESEAKEYMTKPESFEDLPDAWNEVGAEVKRPN